MNAEGKLEKFREKESSRKEKEATSARNNETNEERNTNRQKERGGARNDAAKKEKQIEAVGYSREIGRGWKERK